jgi:CheY-like chemotaxis protein
LPAAFPGDLFVTDPTMPEKLLLVDDEPNLLETLAFNLRAIGYQVVTAADGAAALEQARTQMCPFSYSPHAPES